VLIEIKDTEFLLISPASNTPILKGSLLQRLHHARLM